VAGKLGGSCCDGGSAAVLLLCSVSLPLYISIFCFFFRFSGAVIDDWEDGGSWRWLWWCRCYAAPPSTQRY
jgi:hypothetical protein